MAVIRVPLTPVTDTPVAVRIEIDPPPLGTVAPNSTDPMSQRPPAGYGRAAPRWSVPGGGQDGFAASIRGLPVAGASVMVGPPLFDSELSPASLPLISPVPVRPQLKPLSRL